MNIFHKRVINAFAFSKSKPFSAIKIKNELFFTLSWDFGMSWICHPEGWGGEIGFSEKLKQDIIDNVIYNLDHAFFHVSCDPNYGIKHYALLGCLCLRGRAKMVESDGSTKIIDYIP